MRWCAGIVNHGNYDDLERCLATLVQQDPAPMAVVVYDTGVSPERFESVRKAHPDIEFEIGENRGYAGGANRVVDRLVRSGQAVDFVLVLNPDVELEAGYADRLITAMAEQPRVAIGTGKLLRPDRVTLDSAGIIIPRNRRPRDRGSEEADLGQWDTPGFVDAASGAAMMLRVAALEDLSVEGELFDESFFAYHEDTDLCWRARLFGWRIFYEPKAVAVHRRGWRRNRRAAISVETRRHSFKNHYLQLMKNETAVGFVRNLPWLIAWEVLRLGFVLLRDREVGAAYRDAWRAMPEARRRRALIQAKTRREIDPLVWDTSA